MEMHLGHAAYTSSMHKQQGHAEGDMDIEHGDAEWASSIDM
jgi:hypothetical protein